MQTEITTVVPAVLQPVRPDALAITVAFTRSLGSQEEHTTHDTRSGSSTYLRKRSTIGPRIH